MSPYYRGDLMTTEQLVREAQRGNQDAANQLIDLFYRKICKYYVVKLRLSLETAEELSQDTFEKAWRKLPTLQDVQRFEGWLYAIARNVALDHLRKMKRRRVVLPIDPDFDVADEAPPVESEVLARLHIYEIVHAMPEKHRECLILHIVGKASTFEVAQRLGLEEETVKAYISKARVQLREALYHTKEDRDDGESRQCGA